MEHSDTLLTIAEIAVALAGFASLVSVIGRRRNDASHAVDTFRLRVMLEVAFRNAAFALLPLPFLQFAPSDPILWRVASGLYLVVTATHIAYRNRLIDAPAERWYSASLRVLLLLTALASLANVFGLAGLNAFSLYLANLLFGLGGAGVSFLAVAASVFRD